MGSSIMVGPALLVFESLKKPRKNKDKDGNDKLKWEATIAFPPNGAVHQALLPLEQQAKLEKFGPNYTGPYRSPFRDDYARDLFDMQSGVGLQFNQATGQNQYNPADPNGWRQKCPFLVGMIAVNVKSNDPIVPFHSQNGKSVPMVDWLTPGKFYPGIEVYFETNAYAYQQPGQTPGVSLGLNSIFKHADGTPLRSVSDPSKTYEQIAANPIYAQNPAAAQMFPATQMQGNPYQQAMQQQQQQQVPQQYPNVYGTGAGMPSPSLVNPAMSVPAQYPQHAQSAGSYPATVVPNAGMTVGITPPGALISTPTTNPPGVDPAYAAWVEQQERTRLAAAVQQTRGF